MSTYSRYYRSRRTALIYSRIQGTEPSQSYFRFTLCCSLLIITNMVADNDFSV
jgi:hypothetical protein